jgi:myo-inositol-1(or 4)-monophosphatase
MPQELPAELHQLSAHLNKIAAEAVLRVGPILADAFGTKIETTDKTGYRDLVTEYDNRSEQMIFEQILREHPDSKIVGEESGAQGSGAVQWFVDPLDGTTNFAAGIPFFCVSIGAALNNQLLAGVIYDPLRRELFSANTARATLNGEPITAASTSNQGDAVLLTNFPYSEQATLPNDAGFAHALVKKFGSVRRLGSVALELAYVACGRADVAFAALANTWDVAAGALLIQQAGGQYVPLNRLHRQFHTPTWPTPYFVAAGPAFNPELSTLKPLLD